MSLSSAVLDNLSTGKWSFELLGPHFRSSLIRRVEKMYSFDAAKLHNLPILGLTLLAYRKSKGLFQTTDFTKIVNSRLGSPNIRTVWSDLSETIYSSAIPSNFTDSEIEKLSAAERLISNSWKTAYDLQKNWITSYARLENVHFRSGSHPHAFGCLFFGERIQAMSELELATSIIHEMAHQELFLINLVDRLIEEDFDFNMVHAPFQGKKRPPIGRLHSLYALFRMIQFQRCVGLTPSKYENLFLETTKSFSSSELTPFGQQLVQQTITSLFGLQKGVS